MANEFYRLKKIKKILKGVTFGFIVILLAFFLSFIVKTKIKTKHHVFTKMEILASKVKTRPSYSLYRKYVELFEEYGQYQEAIKGCKDAISFLGYSQKKKRRYFESKLAFLYFSNGNYQKSSQIFSHLSHKNAVENLYYGNALFLLKRYERVCNLFFQRKKKKYVFKNKEKKRRYFFIYGASIVHAYFEKIPEIYFLKYIQSGFQDSNLEKAKTFLLKVIKENPNDDIAIKSYIYLGYASLTDIAKAEKYFAKVTIDSILLKKGLAFLYYCKGEYRKSIQYFLQCSEKVPWNSTFYHFIAQNYLKIDNSSIEEISSYCMKALELRSYELSPLNTLIDATFKGFDNFLFFYSFFINFMKKERYQREPDLWESEAKEIARGYLENVQGKTKETNLTAFDIKYLMKIIRKKGKSSGSIMAQNILINAWNQKGILKSIMEERKNYQKEVVWKKFDEVIKKIKEKKVLEKEKIIKFWMARYFVARDISVIQFLKQKEYLDILKDITLNQKRKILLRFWAASILLEVKSLEAYHFIKHHCTHNNNIVRILCISAMFRSGFQSEFLNIGNRIKSKYFARKYLKNIPERLLPLFFHYTGEYLYHKDIEYFLTKSYSEKVKVTIARWLPEQGKKYREVFLRNFDNTDDDVRTYTVFWAKFPHIFSLQRLLTILETDSNHKVRSAVCNTIRRCSLSHNDRKWLGKRLEKLLLTEKNARVKIQIVSTLSKLGFSKRIINYVMEKEQKSFHRIIFFSILAIDQSYAIDEARKIAFTKEVMHRIETEKTIKNTIEKLGPIILLILGRFGRQITSLPSYLKSLLIITPVEAGLKSKNHEIRKVAAFATMMIEEKKRVLLPLLISLYEREQKIKVKQSILASIIHLSAKYKNKKLHQRFINIAKQSDIALKKAAAYGYKYKLDDWYRDEWEVHWNPGISKWGREKRKFDYNRKLIGVMCANYNYFTLLKLKKISEGRIKNKVINLLQYFQRNFSTKVPSISSLSRHYLQIIQKGIKLNVRELYIGLLITKEIIQCIKSLGKSIQLDPSNPNTYFEQAVLWGFIEEYDKALSCISQAIKYSSSNIYKFFKAQLYYRKKEYESANKTLSKIQADSFDMDLVFYLRGQIAFSQAEEYLLSGKDPTPFWKKAKNAFWRHYIASPRQPDSIIALANIYLWQKNHKKAQELLTLSKVLINREDRKIQNLRASSKGVILSGNRQLAKIIGYYYFCLARFEIQRKDFKKAKTYCQMGNNFYRHNYYNRPFNMFSKSVLKRYPEYKSLHMKTFVEELPQKYRGVLEK